jgi:hypothetical protein
VVVDPVDGSLLVALNRQNRIVRVTQAGVVTTVASGDPLDTPATLAIVGSGSERRLVFTNIGFYSMDAGHPGVLSLPLP